MWRPAIIAVLLMAVVACSSGGGDERTLHFSTGNMSEDAYRAEVRGDLTIGGCALIADLSPQEILDAADSDPERYEMTPTVQASDPDDRLRAAEIVLEECERIAE